MLWIGLHLPALSLEALAATLPASQADQPLALLQAHAVAQANAPARALGVQPGQRRATALALAPQLLLGEACPRRDEQALRAVAHAALAFTPAVTFAGLPAQPEGQGQGQGVLLEVQASLRYFGGLRVLLQRLRHALAPLGHRVRLATAPTALGAALLARWREGFEQGPHSTQRAALRALLDQAPLGLLVDEAACQALQGMGLHTLGDLQRVPRDGLARRFGPALLLALDRARGDAPDPQDWVELPPRFEQRVELFARADTTEQLLAGARVLLARLVAWAQGQQARIGCFTLVMHPERRRRDEQPVPQRLELALAEPSLDAAHLQGLLAERLGRAPLAAPVLELSLVCEALVLSAPPNGELFPTRASQREGLTRLVERLQARLGPEGVQRLQPVADHRPERATRRVPADAPLAPASLASHPAGAGPVAGRAMTRPLWLLPEPQPLAERELRPLLQGRPLQVLAGPERIESGWWDGDLVTRDYYVADAGDGSLVWIYRLRVPRDAGQGSGWFLQGRFA